MCMENREEGCVLRQQQEALKKQVDGIETRLSTVESDVGELRAETQYGFRQGAEAMKALNTSLTNLAHDFGERMNNFDKRIVAEKEKWGDTLRKIVIWTAKIVLAGAALAMGVTVWQTVFGNAAPPPT